MHTVVWILKLIIEMNELIYILIHMVVKNNEMLFKRLAREIGVIAPLISKNITSSVVLHAIIAVCRTVNLVMNLPRYFVSC